MTEKLKPIPTVQNWVLVFFCFALWPSASYAQSLSFAFSRGIENPLFTLSHVVLIIATGLMLGQTKSQPIRPYTLYLGLAGALGMGFCVAWVFIIPDLTLYLLILTAFMTLWVMINIKPLPFVRVLCAYAAVCMIALDSGWHLYNTTSNLFLKNLCAILGTGISVFAYVVCIRLFIKWFNKKEWQGIAIRILASWVAAVVLISIARELSAPVWVWVPVKG